MKVTPVGITVVPFSDDPEDDDWIDELGLPYYNDEEDTERLIEFAGRACYQSFSRPRPATAHPTQYIANLINQGHESVLEHASASFYVEGVSRNMLLELERHRHLSFSVISQRFVKADTSDFIVPPALMPSVYPGERYDDELTLAFGRALNAAQEAYELAISKLEDAGLNRKQAREAARSILPGGMETKFVVTGNMRAWRDVLKKRYSVHADAEICEFAKLVLELLRNITPAVFSDFPEEPFS